MFNRQSVMANQGRQTINAMRAMTPKEYLAGRNIVDQEPCRDLEPDDIPPLPGPLPPSQENFILREGNTSRLWGLKFSGASSQRHRNSIQGWQSIEPEPWHSTKSAGWRAIGVLRERHYVHTGKQREYFRRD